MAERKTQDWIAGLCWAWVVIGLITYVWQFNELVSTALKRFGG